MGWFISPSIGLVAKDIDKLGLSIQSFKEPLTRSVKQVIIPSIRKNFDVGGRPPWEKLAEYTIEVRGSSIPILVRTGKLRRGASQFNIWTINQQSATIKKLPDAVWYGAIHQAGAGGFSSYVESAKKTLGRGAKTRDILKEAFDLMDVARGGAGGHKATKIPQRQFILYQEDDIDDIQQIFYEWLVERTIREGKFSR
jgi:phage gpG-like protein